MFFNMNDRSGNEQTGPMGGMGPMGMMSGMPGPAMMARMMPFMMGQFLSSEDPETRKEKLLEMVTGLVGQSTADLSDDDYNGFVDEIAETLRNREEVAKQNPADCCG